jgi:hypothetical protein
VTQSGGISTADFYTGFAHSIVDINNDFNQDLVLTTRMAGEDRLMFQAYTIDQGTNVYTKFVEYEGPKVSGAIYGQSIFADFG